MDYERLVVDNLSLIDSVVRSIAHRYRLSADEAEELRASIRLKLVDNDYEVLRKFQGRSSVRTYLTTVATRHFLDARNAKWGKWRPSAQARRLGPVAMLLDRLITRDGLQFEQAVQTIEARDDVASSRQELEALLLQLPQRTKRRFVGERELDAASPVVGSEKEVVASLDSPRQADRVESALSSARSSARAVDSQDALLRWVTVRFRTCCRFRKSLYRRSKRSCAALRTGGPTRQCNRPCGSFHPEVGAVLEAAAENRLGGPSLP